MTVCFICINIDILTLLQRQSPEYELVVWNPVVVPYPLLLSSPKKISNLTYNTRRFITHGPNYPDMCPLDAITASKTARSTYCVLGMELFLSIDYGVDLSAQAAQCATIGRSP